MWRQITFVRMSAKVGQGRDSVTLEPWAESPSLDVRQCLLYDSAAKDARLIGIEYMVSKEIYETLDPEEQKLWHSHEVSKLVVYYPVSAIYVSDHSRLV